MRPAMESGLAVIMLTSCQNKEEMQRGLDAGADDFISKSADPAILRARIHALMRRRLFQEEGVRIVEELKAKDSETLQAQAGRQIAEARAAMGEKLIQVNFDLEEANRKLKETQTQLIQQEKMASLGQLVAGIAHEINNPLAFVLNNLFLVETGLDGLCPEIESHLPEPSLMKLRKARVRLGEMQEGLDRVKELVLDLRTFSRLDDGVLNTVDVAETIDTVLLLLKHKMNGRILVEKNYASGRELFCNPGRIKQVLMNLISNAIDAIAGQGTVFVATCQTSRVFQISVRDTGAGISATIRSRIFDPFFTTKPVGQGTGLGLAISYGIVQDHGGSIEVQSEEGVGTEFIVKIPLDLELQGRNERETVSPGR